MSVKRVLRWSAVAGLGLLQLLTASYAWVYLASNGHRYVESDAPRADVALVLGAEVEPDGINPRPFLKGRLDTTAALVEAGRVRVVLVSGDAHGGSGNETTVMTNYLIAHGVPRERIVTDPYGLDTYDSCVRAHDVYGLSRALVVTQGYHLARAVTLCRHAGIDADGVASRCDGCGINLLRNGARDYLAATKAAWDAWRHRPPAVTSAPSPAIAQALASVGGSH